MYKLFPLLIMIDNEKMICSNFFLSKRTVEIYHNSIDKISGGMFDGYKAGPVYLHDARQNITIGFFQQVGKFQAMLNVILQNINEELYNTLKDRIKLVDVKK
jgi:hypothetical protein